MSEYPDPDEEYELMYADELELMRENEQPEDVNIVKKRSLPTKRSLDFSSPVSKKPTASVSTKTIDSVNSNLISSTNDIQDEIPISLTPSLQPVDEILTPETTSNKRTVDDLFGDIGDIDFEQVELPTKRQKTEEENDLDLINKIIEGRKLRQMLSEPSNKVKNNCTANYSVKDNMSLNIPRWPFIPVTNSDGDRIYVRFESEDCWETSLDANVNDYSFNITYAKTWEEARKILEEKQQTEEMTPLSQPLPDVDSVVNNSLWVDKYKPHSYLDLLSEEPVNRALLHWLHLWDKIVFKKEVKTYEPQQRNAFSKRTGQFQLSNKWKGKKEDEPEMDEDGRPHHKVALLCGPPGVGKTTLAHLLAKLAGYRVVELNASDERSTDAFRTALQSATLMRSVLDADKKPNCLILDEIDGAPLPTVELLVKWCTATVESGKKKTKSQPLRRPVIAICNDLYATSLRPVRPVSLVLHVGGVSLSRLASRLSRVAAYEGLAVAPHVAAALAARAQGDVRAAMQVLSFIKARAKAQLSIDDVNNAAIGTKDCNKTMMQALQAVFTVNDKDSTAFMKTVYAAGEYDRLAEGVFENYLSARVDARLHIACETLSWLRLYDAMYAWTLRNQNYSLYGTLPLCMARCHALLASRAPQRMKFPQQAQENFRRKAELDSILWSVWRGSSPRAMVPRTALLLDLLPMMPYLLSPVLRTANVQLCSETERKSLTSCAGAMCDYGLQYVQQRTPDGLYAFVLEPDIYKLAFFGNEERVRPPPPVRQAIAREQQLEVIRRNEEMVTRTRSKNKPSVKSTTSMECQSINRKDVETGAPKDMHLPNHLQRLKPKDVEKAAPQVHKDFFGRVVPITQSQRAGAGSDVVSSSTVFYQYREGYNNAVRQNVRIRDLL